MVTSRPVFHGDDPLLLDAQLSDEERAVAHSARRYCQEKLAPRVLEAFREGKSEPAIYREMGELGLLGATIPESCGGVGLNYVCYGLITRELERVDSGYRSMMSAQSSLVMLPICEFGSEAMKQKYSGLVVMGLTFGCDFTILVTNTEQPHESYRNLHSFPRSRVLHRAS